MKPTATFLSSKKFILSLIIGLILSFFLITNPVSGQAIATPSITQQSSTLHNNITTTMMAVCAAGTITAPTVCTGSTALLTLGGATGTISATHQWYESINGGAFNLVSGGTNALTHTTGALNSANTYDYYCVITGTGGIPCTGGPVQSPTYRVTISSAATVANAGLDQNKCGATTATLAGNAVGAGETGLWTRTGSCTITTNTSPTTGLTGLNASQTLTWTITNGACTSSDAVIITRGNSIAGGTASASAVPCTGGTSSLTLASETTSGCTRQWQQSTNGGAWTNIGTGTDPQVTGALTEPNSYQFRCIVTETATGCTSTSTTSSAVAPSALPTTATAGSDQNICVTTATMGGNTPIIGTGAWSLINGGGTITTATSPTSGLTALAAGANTFRWTITNGACSSTDDVIITNNNASLVTAYASSNCPVSTTSAVLSLMPSNFSSFVSIQWQQSENGGAYTNIAGGTTVPFVATLTPGNTYTFKANIVTACGSYSPITSSAVTPYGMYDYDGGNVNYTSATSASDCYNNLVEGQRYCFSFIYPTSGELELDWRTNGSCSGCPDAYLYFIPGVTMSVSSVVGTCTPTTSATGNCAQATFSSCPTCAPTMYDKNCGVVLSDGIQLGSGCNSPAMVGGEVYYVCMTVPAGCGGMNVCPMINCASGDCSANVLPIELLYLTATAVKDKVQLQWGTSTEINNDYFTVERSGNGVNFEEIGKVRGAGNSTSIINYNFIDEKPLTGISYYRLKQTDYDGTYKRSNLVAVESGSLYPLTLKYVLPDQENDLLQYQFNYAGNKSLYVDIVDIVGKSIFSEEIGYDRGGQMISMNVATLNKGMYILKVSDGIYVEMKKFFY